AHPYSSWERGTNENINKLIRRFIPKGSSIDDYTDEDIQRIEHWINNYPRRIFGYRSSNEMAA
ncbi:MAG: IS30 family transposase, partial [Bacillota bacterium]|nr:IS30 family transposase [Bacillota bacterium]